MEPLAPESPWTEKPDHQKGTDMFDSLKTVVFASHELLSVSSVALYGFAREVDSKSHSNRCFQVFHWKVPMSDVRHL